MYTYPMEAGYSLQVDQGADLISERRVTRESEDAEYGQFGISFNVGLGKKLEFDQDLTYEHGKYVAPYSTDMSAETVPTLFVYCDVLEHVVVADVMAPLLRKVDIKRKQTYVECIRC